MNKQAIIITTAGFVIGLAEALIYYSMGENKDKKEKFTYKIPPAPELAKTAGIVMVTAVLTAGLTWVIEASMKGSPKLIKASV